jgi:hypothetical protein
MLDHLTGRFAAELEEAKRRLEERGRQVPPNVGETEDAGISCDFDLPYSSLATIRVTKWN